MPDHVHILLDVDPCTPQSESETMWRGSADARSASKGCLTPPALYLSTKLPSPPTWSVPTVRARAENALLGSLLTDRGGGRDVGHFRRTFTGVKVVDRRYSRHKTPFAPFPISRSCGRNTDDLSAPLAPQTKRPPASQPGVLPLRLGLQDQYRKLRWMRNITL
jgi:hypothetical protein